MHVRDVLWKEVLRPAMLGEIYGKIKTDFVRDAFTLSASTGLAQIIGFATIPIISRIFSPEEFGLFALYTAIFLIMNLLARLNFDALVVLPDSDEKAAAIVAGLILLSTFATALALVILLLTSNFVAVEAFEEPSFEVWLFFLPISTFMMCCYLGFRYFLLRKREFRKIGLAFVIGTTSGSLSSILLGYCLSENFRVGGLVIGHAVQAGVFLFMVRSAFHSTFEILWRRDFKLVKSSILPYRRLIASLFLSQSLVQAYTRLPVFFISAIYGNPILGFYAMADRLASAPRMLIAQAIGDVYRQRAAAAWNKEGRFDRIYLGTLLLSFTIGIPIFIVGIMFAPEIFSLVLGEEWRISGGYASIIMVGGLFAFIATPLDKGCIIREKHAYMVGWPAARVILKVIAFSLCYWHDASIEVFLWLQVGIRALLHMVDLGCEYIWSRGVDIDCFLRDWRNRVHIYRHGE